jgi:hypothetical protein
MVVRILWLGFGESDSEMRVKIAFLVGDKEDIRVY